MESRIRGNAPGPTASTVAANIKRVRTSRGLTQAGLADRLEAVGRPIPVASIGKIETGLRAVEVDDLMAIAIALDVSPLGILLPQGGIEDVVAITGGKISLGLLWQWVLAEHSLERDDRALAARSLPRWLSVQGDAEGTGTIELVYGEGDSEPLRHQTLMFAPRG